MKNYRKKPVEIEALQWDGSSHRPMFDFIDGTHRSHIATEGTNFYIDHGKVEGGLVIKTLEGEHLANIGDWIIKGVQGEFYPCKPSIFAETYESVESQVVEDSRLPDSNAVITVLETEPGGAAVLWCGDSGAVRVRPDGAWMYPKSSY